MVQYGVGQHAAYIEPPTLIKAVKWIWLSTPFSTMSACFGKVSIALLLMRILGNRNKGYTIFLWVLIALLIIINVLLSIITFAQCTPVTYLWDQLNPMAGYKGTCWDPNVQKYYGYFQGGTSHPLTLHIHTLNYPSLLLLLRSRPRPLPHPRHQRPANGTAPQNRPHGRHEHGHRRNRRLHRQNSRAPQPRDTRLHLQRHTPCLLVHLRELAHHHRSMHSDHRTTVFRSHGQAHRRELRCAIEAGALELVVAICGLLELEDSVVLVEWEWEWAESGVEYGEGVCFEPE